MRNRNFIIFFLSFKICLSIAQQSTWQRRGMDFPAVTGQGEALFHIGEIPDGYIGIGATSTEPNNQVMTVVLLNKQDGTKIRSFIVPTMEAKDFMYNPGDSTLILFGYEQDSVLRPSIAKVDLYGNVIWMERHTYPGARIFQKGVRLPDNRFMLTDYGHSMGVFGVPILILDSLGKMLDYQKVGNFYSRVTKNDIQLWTDSTVLIVANGIRGIPDSVLPVEDCGEWGGPSYTGVYFAEVYFDGRLKREWSRSNYTHEEYQTAFEMRYARLPNNRIVRHIREYRTTEPPCYATNQVVCYDTNAWKIWRTEISTSLHYPLGCWTDVNNDILAFAYNNHFRPIYVATDGTNYGDDQAGQIWKIDGQTGAIKWHKSVLGAGVDDRERNFFNDITPTSDGGILLGFSFWETWFGPSEKWFIKLDSSGCLIKGCDSVWITPSYSSMVQLVEPVSLMISPNPASSLLFYTLDSDISSGFFALNESHGKIQKLVSYSSANGAINVDNLPVGIYFISVYDDQKRLRAVEKLVIQR